MKKLLLVLMIGVGLTACEVRMSGNGDFDGLWQLAAIDSLVVNHSVDMRQSGEFWAVQVHLLEVRNTKGNHGSVLFRFDLSDDSLKLRSPYYDESGEGGVNEEELQKVTANHAAMVKNLKKYGIESANQGYRIVTLDGDEMILQKEDVRLCFRKY
jgi:hypothetical protein